MSHQLDLLAPLLYGGAAYALTRRPMDAVAPLSRGVSLSSVLAARKAGSPALTPAALLAAGAITSDLGDGSNHPGEHAMRRLVSSTGGAALGALAGLNAGGLVPKEQRPLAAALAAALGAGSLLGRGVGARAAADAANERRRVREVAHAPAHHPERV